jgi:hypothetical protein
MKYTSNHFSNMYKHSLLLAMIFSLFLLTSCQKELTWCLDCPSTAYLVKDSFGNCAPIEIGGDYKKNIRTKPGINFVKLYANVESSGSFNLRTDTVNGVHFFTQGNFTSVGRTEFFLYPSGTPINGGVFEYHLKLDTTECVFSINYLEDSTTLSYISCVIGTDPFRTIFNFQATGGLGGANNLLSFSGNKTAGPNPSFFRAQVQYRSIQLNYDYTVNPSSTNTIDLQATYRDDNGNVYKAQTSPQNVDSPFTIRVTRLTADRRYGTFQGNMKKEGGTETIYIKDGKFEFPF